MKEGRWVEKVRRARREPDGVYIYWVIIRKGIMITKKRKEENVFFYRKKRENR